MSPSRPLCLVTKLLRRQKLLRRVVRAMGDSPDFQIDPEQSAAGVINHVELLSSQTKALYQSKEFEDVTFLVENKRFPAHRVVLASRSEYFRALLFGGMREAKPDTEIEIQDTNAVAFDALLSYVYSGKIYLGDKKDETLLDLLGLAHKYGFLALESAIQGYLRSILSIQNVCLIYDASALYQMEELTFTCQRFLDRNAVEVLSTDGFLCLSITGVIDIIKKDSFCAPEVQVFRAVMDWVKNNEEVAFGDVSKVLEKVRLPLISLYDLFHTVRPTNLFTAEALLDAIGIKTESRVSEMHFRGHLVLDENIANSSHGAEVIEGEMKEYLLDGDTTNYDVDRGFSRHLIMDGDKGICLSLGRPSIINAIKLLLWDKDARSYSYYIEVSMDNQDWTRIVDYSKYLCRSWQTLHFKALVARYIRIAGVYNTVNKVFHIVHFECSYANTSAQLGADGVIVPSVNVAQPCFGASVIEGVSRTRNALLNGDLNNYDWDSGYTCHQLGSGAIMVQLAQPYVIGAVSLLLWDCDERCYSFYIEVSEEQRQWEKVVDKTKEECRSWQYLTFDPRPVVFIKIVGVNNTANEVFHCVHFECSASPSGVVGPGVVRDQSDSISSDTSSNSGTSSG